MSLLLCAKLKAALKKVFSFPFAFLPFAFVAFLVVVVVVVGFFFFFGELFAVYCFVGSGVAYRCALERDNGALLRALGSNQHNRKQSKQFVFVNVLVLLLFRLLFLCFQLFH